MIKKVINKQKRQKTNKQRLSPSKKKKKKTKLKISLNFFQRSTSYGVYYDSVISKFFFYFHWILIMRQSPHPIAQATAAYLLSLSVRSGGGVEVALANFVWSGHFPTLDANVVSYPYITKHCLSRCGELTPWNRELSTYVNQHFFIESNFFCSGIWIKFTGTSMIMYAYSWLWLIHNIQRQNNELLFSVT